MKWRRISVGFVVLLACASILACAPPISAGHQLNISVASRGELYYPAYGHHGPVWAAITGANMIWDGDYEEVYLPVASNRTVITNEFNKTWDFVEHSSDTFQGYPPANATIAYVWVKAYFYSLGMPNCTLSYSLDNQAHWESSPEYPKSTTPVPGSDAWVTWNVTTLETWTPALLLSERTWLSLEMEVPAGVSYYIDYLGLSYLFYLPGEALPSWVDPPEETGTFGWNIGSGPIIGLMGIAGFVGMVIAPGFIVFMVAHAKSGNKFASFVSGICFGAFCFGLFMTMIWTG